MHELLADLGGLDELAHALSGKGRPRVRGAIGASPSFTVAALAQRLCRPVVLIHAHVEDAQHAADELEGVGLEVVELPAIEAGPDGVSARALAGRVAAVRRARELGATDTPFAIVGSIHAWMQPAPAAEQLERLSRRVQRSDRVDPGQLIRWLGDAGYDRVDAVDEPGQFAQRGGIIDVFPAAPGADQDAAVPVRLDFFGDEVDRIAEIDVQSLASVTTMDAVDLPAAIEGEQAQGSGVCFVEHCPEHAFGVLVETLEVSEQGRGYFERVRAESGVISHTNVVKLAQERLHAFAELNQYSSTGDADELSLPVERPPDFRADGAGGAIEVIAAASRWAADKRTRALVPCATPGEVSRLGELMEEAKVKNLEPWHAAIAHGFVWRRVDEKDNTIAVLPLHEMLGRAPVRRRHARIKSARTVDAFLDFAPGDHVVHADHGIARFVGLTLMEIDGSGKSTDIAKAAKGKKKKPNDFNVEEFLTLEFKDRARLHVPATQVDLVQKYVGGFSGTPPLSQLGGARWKNQKEKVAESVKDLAGELLRVRAAREASPGIAYPADTTWQKEFEAEFPYQETDDQLAALSSIKRDMSSARPMDRLICGDVGFGKTELAIRAAFKAVEFGKQVAVLVPTTVLAEQHERTFRERFAAYPFRVESISRYKTTKEANSTLKALRKGEVDVIIGTHRLLSKDVRFSDLGLVVIDEEQRFGVEHKEQLLRLRTEADVLTLSATPIPRTLHMAMLGLRDISSLTTPPAERQSVVTEVMPFDRRRIEQAIARELAREGQVFFVHNRVKDIKSRAAEVQGLAPEADIVVGHGQMPGGQLEEVMLKFVRREADILVSTTIIESGIDQPSANTMIIADADNFGLADLHQLRGRVGRSSRRAYCYLLLPEDGILSAVAKKRLAAVEQYAMLGAGFKIAMRDLEIRGAGNLLGSEQSGHIAVVGYDMYCRLLEQAVQEMTGQRSVTHSRIALDVGLKGYIPESYIPGDVRRMAAYRRMALASSLDEVNAVREDLAEAYGKPPGQVERLLSLAELRVALASAGVSSAAVRGADVILFAADPRSVLDKLEGVAGSLTSLTPSSGGAKRRDADTQRPLHEIYWRPPDQYRQGRTLVDVLCKRLLPSGSREQIAAS